MQKILFLMKNTGMHERLGLMGLSALVKMDGHDTKLIITEDLDDDDLVEQVKSYRPDVLAYSIMTGEHGYHAELNEMIRQRYDCLSVFGGPHPTYSPELIEHAGIDAICRGEADVCFPELINRLDRGEDFYDIDNFWFKKPDGEIVKNEMGPLPELEHLPFPDREIMYRADPALAPKGVKVVMAMRGCPYQCTYCFNHAYNKMTRGNGDMLRVVSVDRIIAEAKELKENYVLDSLIFQDDTFQIKPKGWMEELADRFPKEVGLPFACTVRPNMLKDEAVTANMAKAGCEYVWMGVECGNNEVAKNILKRNLSNEKILAAVASLHKFKIRLFTQNLIGLPVDDPLKIDMETLDFNIACKPAFAWSSILYPYPGTEIGDLAMKLGMFDGNYEKIHVSNKTTSALDFGDPALKRKLVNLHKLFGIIVQFPFLRPFTRVLIALPLTPLYTWMFFAFYGYKIVIRTSTLKGNLRTAKHYLRFYVKYVFGLERRRRFSRATQKEQYPNADFLRSAPNPVETAAPKVAIPEMADVD
jgi:anaerobic magnesium-protoporphyrin IX monomethyl ester cyclase